MIYEWRIYEVASGKMSTLHDRFQKVTLRLFKKHGIKVIGFWEEASSTSNRLYYMVAFNSLEERDKCWSSFTSDPEWIEARKETEKNGPIVQKASNLILVPTAYSPLR